MAIIRNFHAPQFDGIEQTRLSPQKLPGYKLQSLSLRCSHIQRSTTEQEDASLRRCVETEDTA
jgi:hypothetical protein